MPQTWPATVPQFINQSSFQGSYQTNRIITQMEVGTPKSRLRDTKRLAIFSGTIEMTSSEYDDFRTFYETTLGFGTDTFYFEHPITGDTGEYMILSEPVDTAISPHDFDVQIEFRQVA